MITIHYQDTFDWILKWLTYAVDNHIDLALVGVGVVILSIIFVRNVRRYFKRKKIPRKRSPFDGIRKLDIDMPEEKEEIIFNPEKYGDDWQGGKGHLETFTVHAPDMRIRKPKAR